MLPSPLGGAARARRSARHSPARATGTACSLMPRPPVRSVPRFCLNAGRGTLEARIVISDAAPKGVFSSKTRRVAFPPPRRAFSLSGQRQARASVCIPYLLDFGTEYTSKHVEPAPRQMTSYSTGASNGNCTARRIPRARGPRRSGSLAPLTPSTHQR